MICIYDVKIMILLTIPQLSCRFDKKQGVYINVFLKFNI